MVGMTEDEVQERCTPRMLSESTRSVRTGASEKLGRREPTLENISLVFKVLTLHQMQTSIIYSSGLEAENAQSPICRSTCNV